jgi:hypothetical protein
MIDAAGYDGMLIATFFLGCNLTLYAVHCWSFMRKHVKRLGPPHIADYRARKLAAEVDKLKRMGYTE